MLLCECKGLLLEQEDPQLVPIAVVPLQAMGQIPTCCKLPELHQSHSSSFKLAETLSQQLRKWGLHYYRCREGGRISGRNKVL